MYKPNSAAAHEEPAHADRMSELPGHLIVSILDLVPIRDAVRTSVLSKRWRYCWREKKELDFDKQFFNRFSYETSLLRGGDLSTITEILLHHRTPISKFYLDRSPKHSHEVFGQKIRHWASLLSKNGVTQIIINNSRQAFKTPRHMFSCLTLKKLSLENCLFKPPTDVEQVFPNLEILHLGIVDFVSGTEICLPQLKDLSLSLCKNLLNFKIKAPKLNSLTGPFFLDTWLLRLLENSPCITVVFMWSAEDTKPVERRSLDIILSKLPMIKDLYVESCFFKVMTVANIPESLLAPITSLKCLRLAHFDFGSLADLKGMLLLLRNSPNLESLSLSGVEFLIDEDVGPATLTLEDPNCLHSTFSSLETVELKYFKGSRLELLFIELLLANSPSLKKLTCMKLREFTAQKILDIAKDVIQFPGAQISFLE